VRVLGHVVHVQLIYQIAYIFVPPIEYILLIYLLSFHLQRLFHLLAHAQEEAIRLNHSNIGTEHLLLGLMKEPEGIAAKVLELVLSLNLITNVLYLY
jgi:hypothetical protein